MLHLGCDMQIADGLYLSSCLLQCVMGAPDTSPLPLYTLHNADKNLYLIMFVTKGTTLQKCSMHWGWRLRTTSHIIGMITCACHRAWLTPHVQGMATSACQWCQALAGLCLSMTSLIARCSWLPSMLQTFTLRGATLFLCSPPWCIALRSLKLCMHSTLHTSIMCISCAGMCLDYEYLNINKVPWNSVWSITLGDRFLQLCVGIWSSWFPKHSRQVISGFDSRVGPALGSRKMHDPFQPAAVLSFWPLAKQMFSSLVLHGYKTWAFIVSFRWAAWFAASYGTGILLHVRQNGLVVDAFL